MVASFSNFYGKLEMFFVLTFENAFAFTFHFKAEKKAQAFLKNRTRDFQNSPPFERSACLYVAISEIFLENENLFQKTGIALFS